MINTWLFLWFVSPLVCFFIAPTYLNELISFLSWATLRDIIKPLLNIHLSERVRCLCCYRSLIINTRTTVRMDHRRFTLVTINRQKRCVKAVGESWNVCPFFLPEIMHCFSNTVSRRWCLERVMKSYPRPSATLSVRDEMNGNLPHRDMALRMPNTRLSYQSEYQHDRMFLSISKNSSSPVQSNLVH